eukprot:2527987-Pyramimonas_sp.AAC.2
MAPANDWCENRFLSRAIRWLYKVLTVNPTVQIGVRRESEARATAKGVNKSRQGGTLRGFVARTQRP